MGKKIKNVLTPKKDVTVQGTGTKSAGNPRLGPVSRGTFVQIIDTEIISLVDSVFERQQVFSGKYHAADIKAKEPFTNKVKRLARDKQNKKQ